VPAAVAACYIGTQALDTVRPCTAVAQVILEIQTINKSVEKATEKLSPVVPL
jgi:hypothetical protein